MPISVINSEMGSMATQGGSVWSWQSCCGTPVYPHPASTVLQPPSSACLPRSPAKSQIGRQDAAQPSATAITGWLSSTPAHRSSALPTASHTPAKDFSQPLWVDTSVEYEIPQHALPPRSGRPLLMVHPQYYEFLRHVRLLYGHCRCQLCQLYGHSPPSVASSSPTRPSIRSGQSNYQCVTDSVPTFASAVRCQDTGVQSANPCFSSTAPSQLMSSSFQPTSAPAPVSCTAHYFAHGSEHNILSAHSTNLAQDCRVRSGDTRLLHVPGRQQPVAEDTATWSQVNPSHYHSSMPSRSTPMTCISSYSHRPALVNAQSRDCGRRPSGPVQCIATATTTTHSSSLQRQTMAPYLNAQRPAVESSLYRSSQHQISTASLASGQKRPAEPDTSFRLAHCKLPRLICSDSMMEGWC